MQGDKKTFKISMVDDVPDALSRELDDIKEYLKTQYELELDLDRYEEASDMIDQMSPATDIAFVDKNLNEASGIDVIRSIRNRYKLLDVLIYSRANIGGDDLAEINNYGIVEIAQRKEQIVDRLKTLIDKNLAKWNDIFYLRGVVISRIIEIELEIDDAFMEFFEPHDDSKKEFRDSFLENQFISAHAKRTVLDQLIKRTKKRGEEPQFNTNALGELLSDRNLLAHSKRSETNPKALVKFGEDKEITEDRIKSIFEMAKKFSDDLASFRQAQARSRLPT